MRSRTAVSLSYPGLARSDISYKWGVIVVVNDMD
jgi:hypothetical protein